MPLKYKLSSWSRRRSLLGCALVGTLLLMTAPARAQQDPLPQLDGAPPPRRRTRWLLRKT